MCYVGTDKVISQDCDAFFKFINVFGFNFIPFFINPKSLIYKSFQNSWRLERLVCFLKGRETLERTQTRWRDTEREQHETECLNVNKLKGEPDMSVKKFTTI